MDKLLILILGGIWHGVGSKKTELGQRFSFLHLIGWEEGKKARRLGEKEIEIEVSG